MASSSSASLTTTHLKIGQLGLGSACRERDIQRWAQVGVWECPHSNSIWDKKFDNPQFHSSSGHIPRTGLPFACLPHSSSSQHITQRQPSDLLIPWFGPPQLISPKPCDGMMFELSLSLPACISIYLPLPFCGLGWAWAGCAPQLPEVFQFIRSQSKAVPNKGRSTIDTDYGPLLWRMPNICPKFY